MQSVELQNTEINPDALWQSLLKWFDALDGSVVLFSGGVDSALVLYAAVKSGKPVTAIIADSPSLPRREFESAKTLAEQFGATLIAVPTAELESEDYQANRGDRCYFCKKTLYQSIEELVKNADSLLPAEARAYPLIDGTNIDDLSDIRPGRKAAKEFGILHPLASLGFRKSCVRSVSKILGLPSWKKPASACLASRIAVNSVVTAERLSMVELAENVLFDNGVRDARVRLHELSGNGSMQMARIELLNQEDLAKLSKNSSFANEIKNLGFDYVCVDLEGYRPGGRVLKGQE